MRYKHLILECTRSPNELKNQFVKKSFPILCMSNLTCFFKIKHFLRGSSSNGVSLRKTLVISEQLDPPHYHTNKQTRAQKGLKMLWGCACVRACVFVCVCVCTQRSSPVKTQVGQVSFQTSTQFSAKGCAAQMPSILTQEGGSAMRGRRVQGTHHHGLWFMWPKHKCG